MNFTKRICLGLLVIGSGSLIAAESTLVPMPHYDWSHVMNAPEVKYEGNQVLHFTGNNKPITDSPQAMQFHATYLQHAKAFDSDADVLRYASDAATLSGYYLEMGSGSAKSLNFIAALNPKQTVYGFDWFKGFLEDWDKGESVAKKGVFKFYDDEVSIPVLKNVVIFQGLFKDVLPEFRKQILKDAPIALLHIDCETYGSTKDVFDTLGSNIKPGTIIVFDEFYNYPNYEQHEWKAFQEFIKKQQLKAEYIAYNKVHEQVAIRIL